MTGRLILTGLMGCAGLAALAVTGAPQPAARHSPAAATATGGQHTAEKRGTEGADFAHAVEAARKLTPEARREKSLAAFTQVASVLRHPRCLNCHPSGDRPHVGDERRVHGMNVQRGPKNHGMPGLHCEACHRTENQPVPNIPGTPHWQLAPRSMGWEGLDDHELATMLIDRSRNGDRSLTDLIHHMQHDPLILWGWAPGDGRSVPPLPHADFMTAVRQWLATGAAIPHKGETTF